ncbi:MAG: BrnT family toxin [Gammaproteobacteria bacterium]|nr:BrnT family toxin [Gammaproteobacteria bacterium]
MKFEWDEKKNKANIKNHGIDFKDIEEFFNHPMLNRIDDRDDYDEERWIGIGLLLEIVGVVIYTERVGNVTRIISARKATKREVKGYEKYIKN